MEYSKKGYIDKAMSMEFLTDLAALMRDATTKGANTLKFTLPKTPEIEMLPDVEVTILWRIKDET